MVKDLVEYARIRGAMEWVCRGLPETSGFTMAGFCCDIVLKEVDKLLGGKQP